MPLLALPFPAIDPVLIQIGPFAIRWYALAYIFGLVLGWQYLRWLVQRPGWQLTPEALDDLLLYVTLGVVLGGRLGYILFYRPDFYLTNALEILKVWQGGMSFHGGLLGVVTACVLFAWRRGFAILEVGDAIACAAPTVCSSAASPISSTPSSGAGRATWRGPWSFRAADPCRAIQASSTRPRSKGCCCSRS